MKGKNNGDPLVSIVCVTYNHRGYIKEAINGFLLQKTTFPIEIIIHDDASTDGTTEIIKSFEEKYPGIIKPIYQKENQWSKGRRITPIAISFAKGKYIALCEGDDYWIDPLKLQKQVEFLEKNRSFSGCFHNTQQIDMNGVLGRIFGNSSPFIIRTRDTLTIYSPFHTSSFLFRNNALQFPAWFSKVISGDMALFSVVSASGPIKKIDKIMSMYRKHENGITTTDAVNKNYHQRRIELMQSLDEFHQFRYTRKIRKVIEWHKNAINGYEAPQIRQNKIRIFVDKVLSKLL